MEHNMQFIYFLLGKDDRIEIMKMTTPSENSLVFTIDYSKDTHKADLLLFRYSAHVKQYK